MKKSLEELNSKFKSFLKENVDVPQRYSSEELRAIIQDVIDGTWALFDPEKMANYDAEFSGDEPYFISIFNDIKGYGFGYLVFHDFLRRVGVGNTFVSTDFTDEGVHLFAKAVRDGLLLKIEIPSNMARLTQWKVIGDPMKNLGRLRDQIK